MSVSRRADLDWLRVLAFGLLIAYHAGMAWSGWSWHITSVDSIDWLREGTHSEVGRFGLDTWLRIYGPHAHRHADQIRVARSAAVKK